MMATPSGSAGGRGLAAEVRRRVAFLLATSAGAAMTVLGLIGEWRSPLNGDAAWILYCARRMLDGERMYVNLVEINPPLVFWLNLPVIWFARLTSLPEIPTYRGFVIALALLSLAACAGLLRRAWGAEGPAALAFLFAVTTVLFAMPAGYFGQREHLVLALITPYLLAAAAELRGVAIGRGSGVALGLAAALALSLKPHFLAVWVGVVLYGWYRNEGRRRRIGAMNWTIALTLTLYALAVVVFEPSYLQIVATLGTAYQRFAARSVVSIMTRDTLPLSVLAALLAYAGFRRAVGDRELADVLALASGGFLLAVVLQGKGFGYHYLPAIGTGIFLLLVMTVSRADRAGPLLRVATVTCAALILLGALWPFLQASARRARGELSPIDVSMLRAAAEVRALAAGRPIAVLSPRLADAFPLVLYSGTMWALRVPHLWCIQARPGQVRSAAERWCVHAVGEDLARRQPPVVLLRRWSAAGPADLSFDFSRALREDKGFEHQFRSYGLTGTVSDFLVYRRIRQ
ncbi:MAG: hypothetical protein H0T86_00905 [Gemmatimonadales bacterium]|nr:hypothetical protein [Gemmatimonadales bacterium]